ncbi:hypothetical protein P3S67_008872 [Capsicum chacoense]|uniref:uncharacterized protein LOC107874587 n=1 Tax=Capsicum annuum TaxID=4072 RepID=UPI0007BF44B7|nr:uncharacterized protein LOC107874587 [Capsicum annuum]KAF3631559.1 putative hit family protein 1-like [Capsicum annuum]KAF3646431.1 putative hit family protein 1-like [Capsicum annuum]
MYGASRMKRVTDPLDEKMKARIIGVTEKNGDLGFFSSGSEHSAHADDDVASPSFSDLVFGDPVNKEGDEASENDSDSEPDVSISDSINSIQERPSLVFQGEFDLYRNVIVSNVAKGMEAFSFFKTNKSMLQRNVMAYLRNLGYNAAICKTKWESSGGLSAGNYEFIDIIKSDSASRIITRYFIDLDFAAQFEIARPTIQYKQLLQSLPNIFVGNIDELKQILRTMSDAARRSLKSRGLTFPPWRKHRFMQNKWLSSYKRTINIMPTANSPALLSPLNQTVKCRTVGFHTTAVNGRALFPAAARTR